MNVQEAWAILGRDPGRIRATLLGVETAQRADAYQRIARKAREMAKELSSKHHPDVGGDPERFKAIWEAVRVIQQNADEFSQRWAEKEKERAEREEKRVKIEFG